MSWDFTYTTLGVTYTKTIPGNPPGAQEQTEAIRAVLGILKDAGGGTITLAAATYSLVPGATADAGCLVIPSNVTLQGAGQGSTILRLDPTAAASLSHHVTGIIRTADGELQADGSISSTTNVTIKNLTIDGSKGSVATNTQNGEKYEVDGFYCGPDPNSTVYQDSSITLENVTVQDCTRYGFDPHATTSDLTFINCTATGNKDGFTIDGCVGVELINCVANNNDRHGINVTTGSSDVLITNATATGNGYGVGPGNVPYDGAGIVVQTGDNEIRDWTDSVTISGGIVSNNENGGIRVTQAEQVNITGVNFTGQTGEIVLLQGVLGSTISSNTINGAALGTGNGLIVRNYLQDFGDTGSANDRWIVASGIVVNGNSVSASNSNTTNAALWNWTVNSNDNSIVGTALADGVAAGNGNDTVYGADGHDRLFGEDGSDFLYGEDGNDTLKGGTGHDTLSGGIGDDALYGDGGNDTLDGGGGADGMEGDWGDDTYIVDNASDVVVEYAGRGTDTVNTALAAYSLASHVERLTGTSGSGQSLTGNGLDNRIEGYSGADTLIGGAGNDILIGGAGTDLLQGGVGIDVLIGGAGADALDGGSGTGDVASYETAAGAVTANLSSPGSNGGDAAGDTYTSIEGLVGSAFGDTLIGNGSANALTGGAGDDILDGLGGNDTLNGGAGDDILDGGTGADTADYAAATAAVAVYLYDVRIFGAPIGTAAFASGTTTGTDYLRGVENVIGSSRADYLYGDWQANTLSGGAGNDHLQGLQGDDAIYGGDDTDLILGDEGADILNGGNERDIIDGGADDDTIHGDAGNDEIYSGAGADTVFGDAGSDIIYIVDNLDTISGGSETDYLVWNLTTAANLTITNAMSIEWVTGRDAGDIINAAAITSFIEMQGQGGNDTLTAGNGGSLLLGGAGSDRLVGGTGSDLIYGGSGADTLRIATGGGTDHVYDFERGSDKIDMIGTVAGFASLSVNNSYAASGWYGYGYGTGMLWVNTGSGGALAAGDFLFT